MQSTVRTRRFLTGFLLMICIIISNHNLYAQIVSNVTVEQVEKNIYVSYDLDIPANISLYISINGGKTYTKLHKVYGAVGEKIRPGRVTIVWDVVAEQGELIGDNIVFKVVAEECDGVPCANSPTVSDYDGNIYKTVHIGKQCWMAENLRTKHYSDGTEIPLAREGVSFSVAYRYYPCNESNKVSLYGYLYNWEAVMHGASSSNLNPSNVQGICPTGWHVPSLAEKEELFKYISGNNMYLCNSDSSYIMKSLASYSGWIKTEETCCPGNKLSENNKTGFNAMPAGFIDRLGFRSFGKVASIWLSTEDPMIKDHYRPYAEELDVHYSSADDFSSSGEKSGGSSVRCVRD